MRTLLLKSTFVCFFLLLLSGYAHGDELEVRVTTIYAHSGDGSVDESLHAFAKELKEGFPGYNRFTRLEVKSVSVLQSETGSLKLKDKDSSTLEVHYRGRDKLALDGNRMLCPSNCLRDKATLLNALQYCLILRTR